MQIILQTLTEMYLFCIAGAFLIPYLICVIIGGIPLFYLEVAVGQFMGIAGVNAWKICPLFQGMYVLILETSVYK